VELIVGALVVLGLLAVATRFITRDGVGEIRLPRIVDDSIGMWALRKATGRRLWERPWDDELPVDHAMDPDASDATRAALGAIAAANAADPTLGRARVVPTRYVASRHRRREIVASPTPVLDLRRRSQAHRKRRAGWGRRFAAIGSVAAVLIVAVVALGVLVLPREPQGQVLGATGRPQSSQTAVVPSYGASSSPGASPVQVPVPRDSAAPVTAIVTVTAAAIPGHSVLSVSIRWSITAPRSGVKAQQF